MCWSHEVSVGFAVVEALTTAFIFIRAIRSKDPLVRSQLYVIPLLLSIILVESVEALLWLDEGLERIDELTPNSRCSDWNKNLSMLLWWIVFPWQPLFYNFPCRRIGHPRNKILLESTEYMAFTFAVCHIGFHVLAVFLQYWNGGELREEPKISSQYLFYQSFSNSETCAYKGINGHLYWTFNTFENFATPNGFAYCMTPFALFFVRPWQFASGLFIFMAVVVISMAIYYDLNIEVASMWCWSGIMCNIYFVLQPYVLPVPKVDYPMMTLDIDVSLQKLK